MKGNLRWSLKFLMLTPLLLPCALVVNTILHRGFGICVVHGRRFDPAFSTRVVYGLPTLETVELARKHRIMLGGCVRGPVDAVCPYCDWPVRLR